MWRENNRFNVECVADPTPNSNDAPIFNNYKSGQIIAEQDLSDLVAECNDGTSLILRHIHFAPFFPNSSHTFTEQSRLAWIGSSYPVPEKAQEIHITYPFTLPCFYATNDSPRDKFGNINREFCERRWRFKSGIGKIDLRKESTVIRIRTDEPINIDMAVQRVMLAMSFCIGHAARFTNVVAKECDDKQHTIISAVDDGTKTNQLLGPCSTTKFAPSEALSMIKTALTNTLENNNSAVELFSHALSISKSRNGYPEDYASACSRALEFTCSILADIDEELTSKLAKECRTVKTLIEALELPLLGNRLSGFLDSLTPFSPGNFLKNMERNGLVTKGTTKAFNDIRHKVAHGTIFSESESDSVYWSVETIKDAFHELTLRKIGYKGKMVQYSVPDWPTKEIS